MRYRCSGRAKWSIVVAVVGLALAAPTVAAALDWTRSTVDIEVGRRGTSLALDSSGHPHVAYHGPGRGLLYARWEADAWIVTVVDRGDDAGWYPSLALDANDRPHISYLAPGSTSELRYAERTGSAWNIEVVDSTGDTGTIPVVPNGQDPQPVTALVLDATDRPHIAYYGGDGLGLEYASSTAEGWEIETVDSGGSGAADVGWFVAMAMDSSDRPHISYHDHTNATLKYATHDGATWTTTVVRGARIQPSSGHFTSIALDPAGNPHISSMRVIGPEDNLMYSVWDGFRWTTELVDTGDSLSVAIGTGTDGWLLDGIVPSAGGWSSVDLDSAGRPHIGYQVFTFAGTYLTRYAVREADGWAVYHVVADAGPELSMVLDVYDRPHFTVVGDDDTLQYAELDSGRFFDDDTSIFEADIEWAAGLGITQGCDPDGVLYCPQAPVTRAQMASFLVRALDLEPVPGDRFVDVWSTHEADINALAEAGITLGCDADGTRYCPDQLVTRGQMGSFLARALQLEPVPGRRFLDVSGTHEPNINAIAEVGITVGCVADGSRFCPDAPVARGQMAALLHRALG